MIDFHRIADGLYVLFDHGQRSDPLTIAELEDAVIAMPLSEVDMAVIDFFYGER